MCESTASSSTLLVKSLLGRGVLEENCSGISPIQTDRPPPFNPTPPTDSQICFWRERLSLFLALSFLVSVKMQSNGQANSTALSYLVSERFSPLLEMSFDGNTQWGGLWAPRGKDETQRERQELGEERRSGRPNGQRWRSALELIPKSVTFCYLL